MTKILRAEHIPYLLKDIGRYEAVFLDKKYDKYYGMLGTEANFKMIEETVRQHLFRDISTEWENDLDYARCDEYFAEHATPKEILLFINKYSKYGGWGEIKIPLNEVKKRYLNLLKNDKDGHKQLLEHARNTSLAYTRIKKKFYNHVTGLTASFDSKNWKTCHSIISEVKKREVWLKDYHIPDCTPLGFHAEIALNTLLFIFLSNDIHNVRRDRLDSYFQRFIIDECVMEQALYLSSEGSRIHNFRVAIISTLPPHTVEYKDYNIEVLKQYDKIDGANSLDRVKKIYQDLLKRRELNGKDKGC